MNVSFLQELLNTVAEQSRALLPKALFGRMLRGETTFSQGIGNGTITVSGDHSRAEELFSCVDFTYPGIRLNGAK